MAPMSASKASANVEVRSRPPLASSTSYQKVTSQVQSGGVHLQCFAGNEPRAQFSQLPFCFGAKVAKEMFGNDQLEDSVTEKFQALIVEMISFRLVAKAGMRQGLRQQERIAKFVTDAFLERTHATAFDKFPGR